MTVKVSFVATTFLDLVASSTMSVLVENRGSWALADYWRPSIEEANLLGGWREEKATQLWNGGTTTTMIAGERREDGELERILGLDESGENRNESYGGESTSCTIQEGGPPADGLLYALPYVGLQELLALEMVSKSLHDAVRGDVLLWQRLHVEAPLNKMLTNEALIRLAKRADGRLQSLSLVGCLRISDEAIEQVLASNPMLLKVCLELLQFSVYVGGKDRSLPLTYCLFHTLSLRALFVTLLSILLLLMEVNFCYVCSLASLDAPG